jgi:GntR family transcriptional regulator/MocR family aminotransferase
LRQILRREGNDQAFRRLIMPRNTLPALWPPALDPAAPAPLYRQLYDALRDAILGGRLAPGARLPATRALAAQLGVSRNTVVNAFEQLLAEGYISGRTGSGTYVAATLPDDLLTARATHIPMPFGNAGVTRAGGAARAPSARGRSLAATPVSAMSASPQEARTGSALRVFRHGLPALDEFPGAQWARLAARRWRRPPRELLGYGDPTGYAPLREALAAYLQASRAVRCTPEQVLIVSGSQQALDLAARVLLDPGDAAWIEDPGYVGARGALLSAGARVVPVPVDGDGLDVAAGIARCPGARLAYVSPSHQYPLGATLSLSRRLALLEWAARAGAWILEDDYDSEFRYAGRPLASLQGLDGEARVIYIGTFSKVLFPALRLGYVVAPPDLVDALAAARALADRHAPTLDQAVLADFIAEGHFARHIRRMRGLYAERQAALVAAARALDGLLEVRPAEAGMHLMGWLPPGVDDDTAARAAAEHGVDALALSAHALERPARGGLLLGYAAFDAPALRAGVRRLGAALRTLTPA